MTDEAQRRALGLDARIARRDFIGGTLALACPLAGCQGAPVDAWTGYGGEGGYAASNGNTAPVRDQAHALRDNKYASLADFEDTGEIYDVVVVGGGLAGLSAARNATQQGASCLLIDNHPVFGGEAKENEFRVDGRRLFAPQGSNDLSVPTPGDEVFDLWRELGLPMEFDFVQPENLHSAMKIGRENFVPMYWNSHAASVGYHFGRERGLVRDMWADDLAEAPLPADKKAALLRWKNSGPPAEAAADGGRWLDGLTYGEFLTKTLGLPKVATDYVDPIVAVASFGVSADAVSAYGAAQLRLPGAYALKGREALPDADRTYFSFPGGNSGLARYFAKRLIPDAIAGPDTFEGVISGAIRPGAFDRASANPRLRLPATVVGVRHSPDQKQVNVHYVQGGRGRRLRARSVVMASGAWVTKHVVRDLPEQNRAALDEFIFAPVMVVNIALRNWRFLDRLGVSAVRWFEGFGFFANIRQPMRLGPDAPPFGPDHPAVLTMYVGFPQAGMSAREQASQGRQQLLNTDFQAFEILIRRQLAELFSRAGFDPRRDIAGIVLNRWGHALVSPQPGFYFGRNGQPTARDIARAPVGRISFGHSQLRGHQNWIGAVGEGARAAREALQNLPHRL